MTEPNRCGWCGSDPLYQRYHDEEWGVPCRDDQTLFEFIILEGMQAGLSWITILKKRDNFRRALCGFDAEQIARFGPRDVERLLQDSGIIRNRLKLQATVDNARAYLAVRERGSFSDLLWGFVDGQPVQNRWHTLAEVPAFTPQSDAMSKQLKKLGFRFVGSTICYAHMQATGMVNDHLVDCWRHQPCAASQ